MLPADLPTYVSVGGHVCPNATLLNSTCIACRGLSGTSGWSKPEIVVEVGGRRALNQEVLETFGAPRAVAVFPDVGNTSGGYWIEVATEHQGRSLADIASVSIGGVPCDGIRWTGPAALACLVPHGTGRSHRVVVENAGGVSTSDDVFFSYERPLITAVVPSRVMTGPTAYNFTLWGNSLALPLGAVGPHPIITVGGNPCSGGVRVISASEVHCIGVLATEW